ncbi:hypothetical protein [Enterococcus sp. LJL51]|uniref:hypothetical protein n=1 Tax=Enterococcus sp. LJL51 TaxID=3416656 RepID=UPI003CF83FD8
MKITTTAMKNTFKRPEVILYLLCEIALNALLYYPLSFAMALASATGTGFSFEQVFWLVPLISALSGLFALGLSKTVSYMFFAMIYGLTKLSLIAYIIQNFFLQSWFSWLLLVFILISAAILTIQIRKKSNENS